MKRSTLISFAFTGVIVLGTWSVWKLMSQDRVSPISRGPSSFNDENSKGDWKKYLSQHLQWRLDENEYSLTLFVEAQNLCEIWSSIEITFRAEGIAYSGEPSRVRQVSTCQDFGFSQVWPKNLMEDHAPIRKVGHFEEEPTEWGLESLRLMGEHGTLDISGIEVFQNTGIVLLINP